MTLLVRWTIGNVQPSGLECLQISINQFSLLYPEAELYVCHNQLTLDQIKVLSTIKVNLLDQSQIEHFNYPIGVAWKLCPPRININKHELFIDNDIIICEPIKEINAWLHTSSTLLLEGEGRHYGRFEKHIPEKYCINSGIFGIPPGLDFGSCVNMWGKWTENCPNESRTWDEQGLVASALTHQKHIMIPSSTVTNCENDLNLAPGMHFIGLNRRPHHRPYMEFTRRKIFL